MEVETVTQQTTCLPTKSGLETQFSNSTRKGQVSKQKRKKFSDYNK